MTHMTRIVSGNTDLSFKTIAVHYPATARNFCDQTQVNLFNLIESLTFTCESPSVTPAKKFEIYNQTRYKIVGRLSCTMDIACSEYGYLPVITCKTLMMWHFINNSLISYI